MTKLIFVEIRLSSTYAHEFVSMNMSMLIHCVPKDDSDVGHYNFNTHRPTLVIFGRHVAERVCYQMVICYPTSLN